MRKLKEEGMHNKSLKMVVLAASAVSIAVLCEVDQEIPGTHGFNEGNTE